MPRRDERSSGLLRAIRLAAIALVLLGVWFLRSREASSPAPPPTSPQTEPRTAPAVPGADSGRRGADAARRQSDQARRPSAGEPAADAAADVADDERHDLDVDERRGGHTLARHVGRTDAQLRERLVSEPDISAASTYSTRALAERTVARTLRENADRLRGWLSRSGNRPNLALDYRGPRSEVLGRSIRRGRDAVACTNALVVLRSAGRDYYVLTTYPEPAR